MPSLYELIEEDEAELTHLDLITPNFLGFIHCCDKMCVKHLNELQHPYNNRQTYEEHNEFCPCMHPLYIEILNGCMHDWEFIHITFTTDPQHCRVKKTSKKEKYSDIRMKYAYCGPLFERLILNEKKRLWSIEIQELFRGQNAISVFEVGKKTNRLHVHALLFKRPDDGISFTRIIEKLKEVASDKFGKPKTQKISQGRSVNNSIKYLFKDVRAFDRIGVYGHFMRDIFEKNKIIYSNIIIDGENSIQTTEEE